MVFDVESIGLHGEGFAAGFVVIDSEGKEHEAGVFACRPIDASGSQEDRLWVANNIPALEVTHDGPEGVRAAFFGRWLHWKERGAVLVADCCWPVEARFLIHCINDQPDERKWQGPYPLHDVASMLLMAGLDPVGSYWEEQDGEKHHPMCDARQSSRLLKQVLLVSQGSPSFSPSPRCRRCGFDRGVNEQGCCPVCHTKPAPEAYGRIEVGQSYARPQ